MKEVTINIECYLPEALPQMPGLSIPGHISVQVNWPAQCACCGDTPTTSVPMKAPSICIDPLTNMEISGVDISFPIPYCDLCAAHAKKIWFRGKKGPNCTTDRKAVGITAAAYTVIGFISFAFTNDEYAEKFRAANSAKVRSSQTLDP